MAHFAKIDPNSLVEDIVFVDNAITANVYIDADDGDKEKSVEISVEKCDIDVKEDVYNTVNINIANDYNDLNSGDIIDNKDTFDFNSMLSIICFNSIL